MEIINTNTLPGDNVRSCSTDALLPPHIGGEGSCDHGYVPCFYIPPECDAVCSYNAG